MDIEGRGKREGDPGRDSGAEFVSASADARLREFATGMYVFRGDIATEVEALN